MSKKRSWINVIVAIFAVIAVLGVSCPVFAGDVGNAGSFVIDGSYGEWIGFPHTAVEYNMWDDMVDSWSAVHNEGDYVYFHVHSEMPAHLAEAGGEFTSGITVLFNDDWGQAFYPRFIMVDDAGNINWDPQLSGLSKGVYHFYVCSRDAWHTSSNISNLNDMDKIYGEAYVSITDDRDDIEYRLDLGLIGSKFGMDASEFKTIQVKYDRLGQQWTIEAGTSTGAVLGVMLCLGFVVGAGMLGMRARRNVK